MAEQGKFLTGNLFRHTAVMSLTASVGLMAVFLVDLADMIFISMLGKEALAAAIGYAGAILFFTSSFGIGVAIAAGALVARAVGAGDEDAARRKAATALVFGVLFGAVFSALVWINFPILLSLVGAEGETQHLAAGYLRIIIPSLPLLLIGMTGGAILRAWGDAKRSMFATVAGGLVNAVLDPILIFGFDLELTGAALASVAARMTIAAVALIPIFRYHGGLKWPQGQEMIEDFKPLAVIAAPAILTQLATPVGQAYVTRAMSTFGADAVAGMAIIGRITPVAFGVLFAASGAIGPIIGQNAGAIHYDRVVAAFKAGLLFCGIVVVIVSAVLFGFRGILADAFRATDVSRELMYWFCGPLALLFFFNGAIFVSNAAFNNLNHPFYSTWVNWGRNTLGIVPFVMVGSAVLGAPGVLLGQYLGGVAFGVVGVVLAFRVIGKAEDPTPQGSFARDGRQMSLWHLRR